MKFISNKMHTIIGLVVGVLLLIAPYLFGFSDNAPAAMVPWIIGLFIILNELITTSPIALVKLVPMKIHVMVDVLTGLVLAVSPWLFGFADATPNAWVPHVIVGILVVGYALMTDTATAEQKDARVHS